MKPTRRDLLKLAARSSAVVSLSPLLAPPMLRSAAAAPTVRGENILVVIQLTGGNDGLNTVVPYGDDAYHANRFTLRIANSRVLKINDYLGFHPAMKGFAKLIESDRLSVIQGVGYPHPNRSHFESMDIWHTAQRGPRRRSTGWLGRYLDGRDSGSGDLPAIHLGRDKQPLALAALKTQVPSVRSLKQFRLNENLDPALRKAIASGASAAREDGPLLGYLQAATTAALTSSRRVSEALGQYKTPVVYPPSQLAQSLKTVAQLIDAQMATRIYYLTLDGFDTHSNQAAAHATLVGQLSGAVTAFVDDLAEHGQADRVAVLCFSEFGRRVRENASAGTDHGAAAPMFLAASRVKSALLGKHPSLTSLTDGDLKFHADFRSVYAGILKDWLGSRPEAVLEAKFAPLEMFRRV